MLLFSTRFRYGAVAQAFHWLAAILVVTAYFIGPGGSEQRVYSSAVDFTRQTHETLGVTAFALVFVRLLWRWVIHSRFGVSGTSGRCCRRCMTSGFLWLPCTLHWGNIVLWVAGLHAVAALFHHFLLRDVFSSRCFPVVGVVPLFAPRESFNCWQ
jgi:cytochrome b561